MRLAKDISIYSPTSFIIKGDICWSKNLNRLESVENGFLICINGKSVGVFKNIPDIYSNLPIKDYTGKLVIPGMIDLHVHASQYAFRGIGMNLELLDWLQTYTFPEEAKFANLKYAHDSYEIFVSHIKKSATTRAVVFATIHRDATILLMDMLEESGIVSYVGKVNMDRNAPDNLRESSAENSAQETIHWINTVKNKYKYTKPILTPRFLPSCSDELLKKLHSIQNTYNLPVQSHLSENPSEVQLVKNLFPDTDYYGDAYNRYGLFGKHKKTIMAHCIYSTPEEIKLIKMNDVFVAHCPSSNMNLCSGIAPIRKYLDQRIHVGLGSDVAGGESESIFREISDCIKASKLYWRLVDNKFHPLSFEEAFYLATIGGGKFFGKVGSFDFGFDLDAIVLDDKQLHMKCNLSLLQRLQQDVYLEADSSSIIAKYVQGREIDV